MVRARAATAPSGGGAARPVVPAATGTRPDGARAGSRVIARAGDATLAAPSASSGVRLLGTYGVPSNAVNHRRQEIGVRMALGAQPASVRTLVIRQGMKLALIGGAIGLIAAAAGSRLLSAVLFGVSALDVSVFVIGWSLMTAVAFIATYVPARRATRVDPMIALRYE